MSRSSSFADAPLQFSGWAVFLKGHWATDSFVTNYIPFILFPILYVGAKFYFRTPLVKPEEMDFITGLKEVEAITYDEPPPRNWVERFWSWLVSASLRLLIFISVHVADEVVADVDVDVKPSPCLTTLSQRHRCNAVMHPTRCTYLSVQKLSCNISYISRLFALQCLGRNIIIWVVPGPLSLSRYFASSEARVIVDSLLSCNCQCAVGPAPSPRAIYRGRCVCYVSHTWTHKLNMFEPGITPVVVSGT